MFDTVLPVAAVKLVRDLAVPFAVQLVVRIQQIQIHTAYCYLPEICLYRATRIRHLDNHVRSVGFLHLRDRQVGEVLRLVIGDLLTLRRQRLGEITVAVEESYCRHIYVAIRCLFDIVARQNSKTAGINFQNMGQTVFHREIGDGRFLLVLLSIHVSAELCIYIVQLLHEFLVLRQLYHAVVAQDVQHHNRVRVGAMPGVSVHIPEQIFGCGIPGPP